MNVVCNYSKECKHNFCVHIKTHTLENSCRFHCYNVKLSVRCEDPIMSERIKQRRKKVEKLNW